MAFRLGEAILSACAQPGFVGVQRLVDPGHDLGGRAGFQARKGVHVLGDRRSRRELNGVLRNCGRQNKGAGQSQRRAENLGLHAAPFGASKRRPGGFHPKP